MASKAGHTRYRIYTLVKVWGIMHVVGLSSEEEKKKGCTGKDLQKKKVLSLE